MANLRSRHRTLRGSVALLAAGGCVVLACSSNDNSGGGGSGAGGTAPGTGGTTSAAGTGAKGGAGGTGGTTGGTGGTSGTGGAAMAGTGAIGTGGTTAQAGSGGSTGVTGGSAGTSAGAGAPGGGAPGAGAGGTGSGATGGGAGTTGGSAGTTTGSGGAPAGGMGGSGGAPATDYTCNEVIGIDSTSEWYMAGFETYVPDGKWQLVYHHPGYIEDWGKASDDVWNSSVTMVTSPCTTNSTNPDRVIFNMFADGSDSSITNKAAFASGLADVITQIKAHYSNVKRIDLLTMTRGPMNVACSSSNAAGSMIPQYEDDAVQMEVASGPPAIIASPAFFAPDCTDFDSTGGPHFSDTGKPIIAKLYGQYYAAGN
ncbi:MAG TPA: hypothetical protein VMI54_16595 [Polyangiaceae bacterium]|nr:hypothetical protein [Polyangiaceae bacterium]